MTSAEAVRLTNPHRLLVVPVLPHLAAVALQEVPAEFGIVDAPVAFTGATSCKTLVIPLLSVTLISTSK